MTKADLLAILAEYPDDTVICDGKGYELHARQVTEIKLDDWANSTKTDDGYEIPGVAIGISIGRKF